MRSAFGGAGRIFILTTLWDSGRCLGTRTWGRGRPNFGPRTGWELGRECGLRCDQKPQRTHCHSECATLAMKQLCLIDRRQPRANETPHCETSKRSHSACRPTPVTSNLYVRPAKKEALSRSLQAGNLTGTLPPLGSSAWRWIGTGPSVRYCVATDADRNGSVSSSAANAYPERPRAGRHKFRCLDLRQSSAVESGAEFS
jgi:hypothetical protein